MSEAAENVDAMIQEAMAPEASPEATLEGQPIEAPQHEAVEEQAPETPDSPESYTIKYKGKEIGLDNPKYRDFAQKGYDYEQKMHQFRVDSKLKEQEYAKREAKYKELEQINDYAKENPQFERLIQEEWARVQAGQPREVSAQDKVQVLEARLNQVMDTLTSQKEAEEARRVAEMEASQEGAISKYKESHPDFDWVKKDGEGRTLEDKIGQAMIDNGVSNFQIMADSFLLKEHMDRKTLEGKETVAKDIQKANKLGLGKVTKKPQMAVKKSENVTDKSYDQLIQEGLAELGIEY
jgi:hypothetical protein